jgi:MFS family permease
VLFERYTANPILPLELFKRRDFTGINLVTLLLYGALSGVFYFLPFVMIQVDGYDATVAGTAMVPFVVLMVVLSRFSGALAYRIGARALLVAGPAVTAAGFGLFGVLHDLHYWNAIFPAVTVVGIGMGITVAPLTSTMLESVPGEHVGLASGVNNAVSRVAGLLAIAVFGALLSAVYSARLEPKLISLSAQQRRDVDARRSAMAAARFGDQAETSAVRRSYVDAFRGVAFAGSALALLSAAVSGAMLPGRRATARSR